MTDYRFSPRPRQLSLLGRLAPLALLAVVLAGCNDSNQAQKGPGAMPPPTVIVERARFKDFANENTYTGRIEAIDEVGVRARIQGYIKKRHFQEGAEVKAGELLFEIEPDSFEVVVRQAEANLASAQAGLTLAEKTFERTENLARRATATQASLDDARSALVQAQAGVKAREADLQKANLDLSYTRITAPIEGRTGRAAYTVGAFVSTSSDPLVTVVAQDPMYVTFPVPARQMLKFNKAGNEKNSVYVELKLADGSTYPQKGQISFADVQATSGTDSVNIRATIANPSRLLVDKQLVQVAVVTKKLEPQLVISQSALLLDQQGAYVFVVDKNDKVEIRRITPGQQRGPLTEVVKGLKAGERVVISGHQKVQPGKPVSPSEAQEGALGMGGMGGVVGMGGMSGKSGK